MPRSFDPPMLSAFAPPVLVRVLTFCNFWMVFPHRMFGCGNHGNPPARSCSLRGVCRPVPSPQCYLGISLSGRPPHRFRKKSFFGFHHRFPPLHSPFRRHFLFWGFLPTLPFFYPRALVFRKPGKTCFCRTPPLFSFSYPTPHLLPLSIFSPTSSRLFGPWNVFNQLFSWLHSHQRTDPSNIFFPIEEHSVFFFFFSPSTRSTRPISGTSPDLMIPPHPSILNFFFRSFFEHLIPLICQFFSLSQPVLALCKIEWGHPFCNVSLPPCGFSFFSVASPLRDRISFL